ncbi:uncharacterized protein LOC131328509 [Rhododendron vialii]|uniref:uncharacterized protein LOC131328509 n=1 Tax=Rhododendron vialii TaxID=182163 RepID=UPI00265F1D7D|nr:uncharacterized protein LOC131328509 [Rhododendron vialii]
MSSFLNCLVVERYQYVANDEELVNAIDDVSAFYQTITYDHVIGGVKIKGEQTLKNDPGPIKDYTFTRRNIGDDEEGNPQVNNAQGQEDILCTSPCPPSLFLFLPPPKSSSSDKAPWTPPLKPLLFLPDSDLLLSHKKLILSSSSTVIHPKRQTYPLFMIHSRPRNRFWNPSSALLRNSYDFKCPNFDDIEKHHDF